MSVKAMAWAWDVTGVTMHEKMILLALADHSDSVGRCWPGQDGLAEKCSMARESVNRICKRLADRGLIRIVHRAKSDGTRNSNLYILPIGQSDPESLCRANQSDPESNQSDPESGQSDAGSHKPSENRKREPSDSPKKRKTRIPDNFTPSEHAKEFAQQNGLNLSRELFKFRNHAIANDRRMVNWAAAFNTWLGNAADWSKTSKTKSKLPEAS